MTLTQSAIYLSQVTQISSLCVNPIALSEQIKGKEALRLPITLKDLLFRAKDLALQLPKGATASVMLSWC